LLDVQDLRSGYGRVEVLRGVSLQVHAGEIVALLGSNGAGKSTLNNTVCALVRASAGRVRLRRPDITHMPLPRQVVQAGLIQVPEGRRVCSPTCRCWRTWSSAAYTRVPRTPGREPGPRVRRPSRAWPNAAPGRRHDERRRAADAGHRPRPDGRAALLILDEPSLGLSPLLVKSCSR
jgi:branched-chain amino acid transport system ATP-binding protein